MSQNPILTTSSGAPVADNQNSMTAGPRGPVLMQDFHLLEKLAHFRHVQGAGGTFKPVVDLVLQQLGGLVEQVDRSETVGKTPDQLVAAAADRRQLAELVEHPERLDRRQLVALWSQKDLREQVRGQILRLA